METIKHLLSNMITYALLLTPPWYILTNTIPMPFIDLCQIIFYLAALFSIAKLITSLAQQKNTITYEDIMAHREKKEEEKINKEIARIIRDINTRNN